MGSPEWQRPEVRAPREHKTLARRVGSPGTPYMLCRGPPISARGSSGFQVGKKMCGAPPSAQAPWPASLLLCTP